MVVPHVKTLPYMSQSQIWDIPGLKVGPMILDVEILVKIA